MKAVIKTITNIFSGTDGVYEIWDCTVISGIEHQQKITVVNKTCPLAKNTTYTLELNPVIHPKYGLQYNIVNNYSLIASELNENMERGMLYLCTNSDRMVDNILKAYPHFCSMILQGKADEIDYHKIYNVGKIRLKQYINDILRKYGNAQAYLKYSKLGYTTEEIDKLLLIYPNQSQLEQHITELYRTHIIDLGHSFDRADKQILEHNPDLRYSYQRCVGLLGDLMYSNQFSNKGSTCTPLNKIIQFIIDNYPELKGYIAQAINDSNDFVIWKNRIGFKGYLQQEKIICENIIARNKIINWNIDWTSYTVNDDIVLTPTQSKLLEYVSMQGVTLLCGYAGTGKTSSLNALIDMLEDNDYSYTLLAPTGIAAKKLSEATHRTASTIHRALGLRPANERLCTEFSTPVIKTDICIVDEVSMCGTYHLSTLFNAMSPSTKLLLIGDNAQLASISYGNVLNDLIQWGQIPTVFLTEVFRYGKGAISTVATDTRNEKPFLNTAGEPIYEGINTKEYNFIPITNYTKNVVDIVLNNFITLFKTYGIENTVILTPYNIGDLGTKALNKVVQNYLYADKKVKCLEENDNKWYVGDIVINIKNLYRIQPINSQLNIPLYNGDIGRIVNIEDNELTIKFDNHLYTFDKQQRKSLLLAYALTVHKVQGAQMKGIVLCTMTQHNHLLSNNLLYVALTRAEKQIIHIGNVGAVNHCLPIHENQQRDTWLPLLLPENFNETTNNTTTIISGA